MSERPILFSAPMIRAILAGTKTQTRRAVKPQPEHPDVGKWLMLMLDDEGEDLYLHGGALLPRAIRCPYGKAGDRLWVRETFMHAPADYCWQASVSVPSRPAVTTYRADVPGNSGGQGWSPSMHMPRWASRITLEITGVRVERLQDISEADAMAEGVVECSNGVFDGGGPAMGPTAQHAYFRLWESIYGPDSWAENPFVWRIAFQRVEAQQP